MEKKTELLECKLTNEELLSYGQLLSVKNKEVVSLEAQKKATMSEYAAKINLAKAEIDNLSGKVSTGREYRRVEVRVEFNVPRKEKKTIYHEDTGEMVREENMTGDECQDLFIDAETKESDLADGEALAEDMRKIDFAKKGKAK
jgi:hypothetical protein